MLQSSKIATQLTAAFTRAGSTADTLIAIPPLHPLGKPRGFPPFKFKRTKGFREPPSLIDTPGTFPLRWVPRGPEKRRSTSRQQALPAKPRRPSVGPKPDGDLSPEAQRFLELLDAPKKPSGHATSHRPSLGKREPKSVSEGEKWDGESWAGETWKDSLTPTDYEPAASSTKPRNPKYLGRRPRTPQPWAPRAPHLSEPRVKYKKKDAAVWTPKTIFGPSLSSVPTHRVHGTLQPLQKPVLADVVTDRERPRVAELSHGLERVLFNPGVHWLQDPRSRVYNFTPWLQTVPKVTDFDFDRIPGFVPSSRDDNLRTLAKDQNRRFAGSTSSLSGILSHCYFLLSDNKNVDTSCLSQHFQTLSRKFTPSQRWPASVILNYKDGIYTIDAHKSGNDPPEKNILTWLGTLLEKFLTASPNEFSTLLKSTPLSDETKSSLQTEREAYRYAKSNDFVMRSQLDCYDSRLPGTGVFDIKTRACMPTRLDVLNYEEHAGYNIKKLQGEKESFEREYFDLIRSAFLKYGFQVRIGNMDGVIVAYHNTETLFGFQYIPLSEMDERLFGPGEGVGDRVFEKCVGLMEKAMNEVAGCFGNQSCKATFLTPETDGKGMDIWVEPLEWDGAEDQKPIQQLSVKVNSYLGDVPVPGHRAVSESTSDTPWTLEYGIERLPIEPALARKRLEAAQEDVLRSFLIPSGVDMDGLEEYWHSVMHGNCSSVSAFDPSIFKMPRPFIQELREGSRKGREESDALLAKYKDEPKIVLGATN